MTKLSMTVKTDDVTSGTMDVYPRRRVRINLWVNEEIGWWWNYIGNSAKIDFLTCDPSTPCNY